VLNFDTEDKTRQVNMIITEVRKISFRMQRDRWNINRSQTGIIFLPQPVYYTQ